MTNVNPAQIVPNFEELVTENQVQTAVEILVAADGQDQSMPIAQTSPELLERLFQALPADERSELMLGLSEEARDALAEALGATVAPGTDAARAVEDLLAAAAEEATGSSSRTRARAVPSPRRKDFSIVGGRLREAAPGQGTVTIYSNPTPQEQRALVEVFGIDEHALASALDPEELSRLEVDDDVPRKMFVVWTRPRRRPTEMPELLDLASMGFFLDPNHLTIVTQDEVALLRAGDRADSLPNLMLRIMASTVNEFIVELKSIRRTSQEIGQNVSRALENRDLLRMFDLSEGLIYHINALEANGGVLRRLRATAKRTGFNKADTEFLEDTMVDSSQCIRQARTFSTVLAGLMDARGNLINNNMNQLIKNLTIINVVFLPLAVIASMGGMSEFSLMLDAYSVDRRVGYPIFAAAMALAGLGLLRGVRFWIDRTFGQ